MGHALSGIFAVAIGTCKGLLLGVHSFMPCAMLTTLEDACAMSASVRSLHGGASSFRSCSLWDGSCGAVCGLPRSDSIASTGAVFRQGEHRQSDDAEC